MPHDLLKVKSISDLIYYTPVPEWVGPSIEKAPYVVIRRATSKEGYVAVGVRGSVRSERFAAFLPINKIIERIPPEQLADEKKWKEKNSDLYVTLGKINEVMNENGFSWGPVGSVGFELASGVSTVNKKSDIDLIIRYHPELNQTLAQKVTEHFSDFPVKVDVQIETNEGAFSLTEFAYPTGQHIMVRTMNGPVLKKM